MRAPVLLNLLKDLRKRNELQGLPQNIFIFVVYYKNFIVSHIIYISCCRSHFFYFCFIRVSVSGLFHSLTFAL